MIKVLVVDDDSAIRELLGSYLEREGYQVLTAEDGAAALELAPKAALVILDLMLPHLDGWEVARVLQRECPELPLVILTARGAEDDRVLGLELGADDYVVKPFSPRELMARVKARLRRSGLGECIRHGELVIRPSSREVWLGEDLVSLSSLEFDLLLIMARHPGLAWSRSHLLERVWGAEFLGLERVVDARISVLRKKLRDTSDHPLHIETVHGFGYRFKER